MLANMLGTLLLLLLAVSSVFCNTFEPVNTNNFQMQPIDSDSYKFRFIHAKDGSILEQLVQKIAPGVYGIAGNIKFKPTKYCVEDCP